MNDMKMGDKKIDVEVAKRRQGQAFPQSHHWQNDGWQNNSRQTDKASPKAWCTPFHSPLPFDSSVGLPHLPMNCVGLSGLWID